jgi:uncharacterized protein YerC
MTQVSKYQLNSKVYEKIFSLFPQFLYRMTNKGQQNLLVNAFFTGTEKIVFAKRIAIAFMLVKGYRYDQIISKIKVSNGTVAKIAEALRTNDGPIIKELEAIAKEDAFKEFLGSINYQISSILPPKGGKWSSWKADLIKEKENTKSAI